jgi:hypothetical protein
MVVKSYWRGVQLEKNLTLVSPSRRVQGKNFSRFLQGEDVREAFPAKAASWVIGQAMLSKV